MSLGLIDEYPSADTFGSGPPEDYDPVGLCVVLVMAAFFAMSIINCVVIGVCP